MHYHPKIWTSPDSFALAEPFETVEGAMAKGSPDAEYTPCFCAEGTERLANPCDSHRWVAPRPTQLTNRGAAILSLPPIRSNQMTIADNLSLADLNHTETIIAGSIPTGQCAFVVDGEQCRVFHSKVLSLFCGLHEQSIGIGDPKTMEVELYKEKEMKPRNEKELNEAIANMGIEDAMEVVGAYVADHNIQEMEPKVCPEMDGDQQCITIIGEEMEVCDEHVYKDEHFITEPTFTYEQDPYHKKAGVRYVIAEADGITAKAVVYHRTAGYYLSQTYKDFLADNTAGFTNRVYGDALRVAEQIAKAQVMDAQMTAYERSIKDY